MQPRSGTSVRGQVRRRQFLGLAGAAAGGFAGFPVIATGSAQAAPPGSSIAPRFPVTATAPNPGSMFYSKSQAAEFLKYDPEHDPSAKYFRSRVPIGNRIRNFPKTQAVPPIDARAGVAIFSQYYMPVNGDNDRFDGIDTFRVGLHEDQESEFQYWRYGSSNKVHVSRFMNYHDIVCSWTPAWEPIVMIPNPAYTDVAHRNGSLVLGIVQQPYYTKDATDPHNWIHRTEGGTYPIGDKLVDLAGYFGFDGYLIDIEGYFIGPEDALKMREMFVAMHTRAERLGMPVFHAQLYDHLNADGYPDDPGQIDESYELWFTSGAMDSYFAYHLPDTYDHAVVTSETCHRIGLDPFKVGYAAFNLEGSNHPGADGQDGHPTYHPQDPRLQFNPRTDPWSGEPRPGLGGLWPLNGTDGPPSLVSTAFFNPLQPLVHLVQNQHRGSDLETRREAIYTADRQFWSGATGNPAVSAKGTAASPYGVANYFAERSVIGSYPFVSRFNVGTGDRFFLDGRVRSTEPWFNIGVQDILPSWQWWTRTVNGSSGSPVSVDYDTTAAWNGGSSLKIWGDLGPANPTEVRLFKTELEVGSTSSLNLICRDGTPGATRKLSVGLVFQDAPDQTTWVPAAKDEDADREGQEWRLVRVPLTRHSGRVLAAVSLAVEDPERKTAFKINIGQLSLLDNASWTARVKTPSGFRVEKSRVLADRRSAEVRLSWDFDPAVWYYDISRMVMGSAPDIWLGRVSGDCFYVSSMPRVGAEKWIELVLVAVGPNGRRNTGRAAYANFGW